MTNSQEPKAILFLDFDGTPAFDWDFNSFPIFGEKTVHGAGGECPPIWAPGQSADLSRMSNQNGPASGRVGVPQDNQVVCGSGRERLAIRAPR